MIALLSIVLAIFAAPFKSKSRLEAENAALRHQLIVLRRKMQDRVRLTNNDRWFFIQLYRWFPSIRNVLTIIRPETLVRWHRAGFRCYWRWKSHPRGGRPQIDTDLRALIRRMSIENPLWGAPRIHGELLKLGFAVAQLSVAKCMGKQHRSPSQEWRTFLRNHAPDIAAMDLFVAPSIGFDLLYAFIIVRLDRRDLVWINVTTNPTAERIARQLTEAFPWVEAPRYLTRDRDRIYGAVVTSRLRAMGIRDKPTAPASPWQNGFAERLIGSIRRECVDHFIVLGEAHLRGNPAILCTLLQRRQNASVIEQRCAGLSARSADWENKFMPDPWRPSSPLRPGLGFRYTQWNRAEFLNVGRTRRALLIALGLDPSLVYTGACLSIVGEAMDVSPAKRRVMRRVASVPRDPGRTRAAILRAATAEITTKGLNGARVDTIAKRAGVNKRMLYHYFGNKQGLYLSVLEETYAAIRNAEIGLNLTELDPAAGMRKLVLFTWQYFIDHPEFLSLLATENLNRASYLKKSKRIRHLHAPLVDMISGLLERGAKEKIFRSGIDPVDLYISIAALGFFYMSNRHTLSTIFGRDLGTPPRLAQRGEHIVDMVMTFLQPAKNV